MQNDRLHPPRAYIHVGPHKTGSTLLQDGFARHAASLSRDGIEVPQRRVLPGPLGGSKATANLALHLQGRASNATLWRSFIAFVDNVRRRRRTLLLSSEEFAQGKAGWPGRDGPTAVNISALASALHGFDVTIMVGYRPFYDWVRGVHAQCMLPSPTAKLNSPIPYDPLVHWLSFARIRALADEDGFFTAAVAQRYAAHGFGDLRFLPLGDGILVDAVCGVLRANTTCNAVRQDRQAGHDAASSSWARNAKSGKIPKLERALARAAHGHAFVPETTCVDRGRMQLLLNLSLYFEHRLSNRLSAATTKAHRLGNRVHAIATFLGLGMLMPVLHLPGLSLEQKFLDAEKSGMFCSAIRRVGARTRP